MKKDQSNSNNLEINKLKNIDSEINTENIISDTNIDYELDEIEINKMLDDFDSEEIDIPEKLSEELESKLNNIKPKKTKYILKGLVACSILIVISYTVLPSFRSFASDILKLLFPDVGVQNAVDNGYIEIEGTTLKVDDFTLEVDNIVLDELRLTFDVTMTNTKLDLSSDTNPQYRVECKTKDNLGVTTFYSDGDKKNSTKSSITIMDERIGDIFNDKKESIELELEILKEYYKEGETVEGGNKIENSMLVGKGEFKTEVVGSTKLIINIPKEIYKSKKIYEIDKTIKHDKAEVEFENLEVSPTMMYLDTKINFEDGMITSGLYNISILSDSGYSYNDNLILSGLGKEGSSSYRQTIVPSIYYDKGKDVTLKADGIIVQPEDLEIELKLDDKYPKKVEYFGSEMTIENIVYKDGEIDVHVKGNKQVSHAGFSKLDGEDYIASGAHSGESDEDREYIFAFKGEKKDSYIFSLNMMMKYEAPIELKIPIK